MMRIGFDNDKYISMQSQKILDRISYFGGKLYLESAKAFRTIITLPESSASNLTVKNAIA